MEPVKLIDIITDDPVIAAVDDEKWQAALDSPVKVLFYLSANILSVRGRVTQAHEAGKIIIVHLDLAEGIGKDSAGIAYLADCGIDGIISTRGNLIRQAKNIGLVTIQRLFALDSKGLDSIAEMVKSSAPHMMEIMPGVVNKAITRFSSDEVPIIAGGLLESKYDAENMDGYTSRNGLYSMEHLSILRIL